MFIMHALVLLVLVSGSLAVPMPDPFPAESSPRVITLVTTSMIAATSLHTCGLDTTEHPDCKTAVVSASSTGIIPSTTLPPGLPPFSDSASGSLPASAISSPPQPTSITSGSLLASSLSSSPSTTLNASITSGNATTSTQSQATAIDSNTPATTIAPGQSPVTINTVPVSLGLSGILVVGTSTTTIPPRITTLVTIGNRVITVNPDGIVFAPTPVANSSQSTVNNTSATTITPGQPLVTIDGVPVLFGLGGIVVIGSRTIPPSVTSLVTLGNMVFTVSPDGVVFGAAPIVTSQLSSTSTFLTPAPNGPSQLTTPTLTLPSFSPPSLSTGTQEPAVISTMTTSPSGFSTQMMTNTFWTTNTWVTTEKDGVPTIVPVLVGCPGCGGAFGGIILWGLPPVPKISFSFPGFPNLPKFHLPCIKVFGIESGGCSRSPSTDSGTGGGPGGGVIPPGNQPGGTNPPIVNPPPGGGDGEDNGEDEDDDDPDESGTSSNSTPRSTQSATSTSQSSVSTTVSSVSTPSSTQSTTSTSQSSGNSTTSTSTSTSSSTCSQSPVTSCTARVVCQSGQSGSQCATVTQVCQTITACSMTGTTVAATATAKTYVIYPPLASLPKDKMTVQDMLHSFFPNNLKAVKVTDEPHLGILWWEAPLTDGQKIKIQDTKLVRAIVAICETNCPDYSLTGERNTGRKKIKRAVVKQERANDEMVFFSWEPCQTLADYNHKYLYDDSAGNNIPVYIIDFGANLNNPEFADVAARVRWIHVQDGLGDDVDQNDLSSKFHGSCMLSKVAGRTLGVAKKALPILVRVGREAAMRHWIRALALVSRDLGFSTGRQQDVRAVVSMSFQFATTGDDAPPKEELEPLIEAMKAILNQIEEKGGIAITGSGNHPYTKILDYPAVLGESEVESLLVVGATDARGAIWRHNVWTGTNFDEEKGLPHVYAPGFTEMVCAGKGLPAEPYRETNGGTSIATASVAGLAAYFMALPPELLSRSLIATPQLLKRYIISKAWMRPETAMLEHPQIAILSVYNNYKLPRRLENSDGQEKGSVILPRGLEPREEASLCLLRKATISSETITPTTIAGTSTQTQGTLINSPSPAENSPKSAQLSSVASTAPSEAAPTPTPTPPKDTMVPSSAPPQETQVVKARIDFALLEHPDPLAAIREPFHPYIWVRFQYKVENFPDPLCYNWKQDQDEYLDEDEPELDKFADRLRAYPVAKKGFILNQSLYGKDGCVYKGSRNEPGEIWCGNVLFSKCKRSTWTKEFEKCLISGKDKFFSLWPRVTCPY